MNLNLKTDYSLRILLYLANHPGETVPVREIARSFAISANHLVKVAQALAQIGVVELVRGRAGGVRLAAEPKEIRLGAIIRRVEGSLALVECFDQATNTCVIAPICDLKHILGEAQRAFFAVLDKYCLADLHRNPDPLRHLLDRAAKSNPALP